MVQPLTPREAAQIARDVYKLREDSIQDAGGTSSVGLDTSTFYRAHKFEGQSGFEFAAKKSGFGYFARAKGTSSRAGEAIVATRGTKTIADWITDAKIGSSLSSCGHIVHAGFNDTFQSFKSNVVEYIDSRRPTCVHCIGHSLGGALATLAASLLSKKGYNVKLYTFGCPRVGFLDFSMGLTKRVGSENIYRVYHTSDPVSMIPIFPYIHVPHAGYFSSSDNAYPIKKDSVINFSHHFMKNYILSIPEGANWRQVGHSRDAGDDDRDVQGLIGGSSGAMGKIKMFGAAAWRLLKKALRWILKAAGGIAFTGITAAVTILDKLAYLLYKGVLTSVKIAEHVTHWITAVLKFLGRSVIKVGELTVSFIRYILDMLWSALSTMVATALNHPEMWSGLAMAASMGFAWGNTTPF